FRKGWVSSLAEGEAVRHEYVDEIDGFFDEIGDNGLHLAYGRLLERPDDAVDSIAALLRIPATPMLSFLRAERPAPAPLLPAAPLYRRGVGRREALFRGHPPEHGGESPESRAGPRPGPGR